VIGRLQEDQEDAYPYGDRRGKGYYDCGREVRDKGQDNGGEKKMDIQRHPLNGYEEG